MKAKSKKYRCRFFKADRIYAFKSNTEVAIECITFDNDSIYLSKADAISFANEILKMVDEDMYTKVTNLIVKNKVLRAKIKELKKK